MNEHSKKQLKNSNKIASSNEKDPFTKSFELQGKELEEELRKLDYVVDKFSDIIMRDKNNQSTDGYII